MLRHLIASDLIAEHFKILHSHDIKGLADGQKAYNITEVALSQSRKMVKRCIWPAKMSAAMPRDLCYQKQ